MIPLLILMAGLAVCMLLLYSFEDKPPVDQQDDFHW